MCILITSATLDAIHREITNIKDLFTVDSLCLKRITDHFIHQLEDGLTKSNGEIVHALYRLGRDRILNTDQLAADERNLGPLLPSRS